MYLVLEALMLISMGGLIIVFQNDLAVWTIVLKTLASLFFVLAGLCGYIKNKQNKTFSQTMMIALFCSMAGDVFLAFDKDAGILFVLGVVSFALAHIMFSVSFCRMAALKKTDFIGTFIIFAAEMIILCTGNFNFNGMFLVLAGYAAIISFMVMKALSIWKYRHGKELMVYMIMAGSVMFLLSDNLLLFWIFGIETPKEIQSACWFFYYLAQGCLSASLSVKQPQGQSDS